MLTITDVIVTGDNVPWQGVLVSANTLQRPFRQLVGGVWVLNANPVLTATTDANGSFTLSLPWPSESDPSTTTWQVLTPDGQVWTGAVPEGVAGPVTLRDLKNSHGWGLLATPRQSVLAVQGLGVPDHTNVPAGYALFIGPNGPLWAQITANLVLAALALNRVALSDGGPSGVYGADLELELGQSVSPKVFVDVSRTPTDGVTVTDDQGNPAYHVAGAGPVTMPYSYVRTVPATTSHAPASTVRLTVSVDDVIPANIDPINMYATWLNKWWYGFTPSEFFEPTSNVLADGFETGLGAWATGGTFEPLLNTSVFRSGTQSAQLGSSTYTGAASTSYIQRTVAVPTIGAGQSVYLTFYGRCIGHDTVVYDPKDLFVFDATFTTQLANPIHTFDPSGSWTKHSVDLSAYAGTTVGLRFQSADDNSSSDPTAWLIDDVSVDVGMIHSTASGPFDATFFATYLTSKLDVGAEQPPSPNVTISDVGPPTTDMFVAVPTGFTLVQIGYYLGNFPFTQVAAGVQIVNAHGFTESFDLYHLDTTVYVGSGSNTLYITGTY